MTRGSSEPSQGAPFTTPQAGRSTPQPPTASVPTVVVQLAQVLAAVPAVNGLLAPLQ
jgi:hypothetical protein